MTKTMTYAQALEIAIETLGEGEAVERLVALKAQLAKRASADRKPSKVQVANEGVKSAIVEALADGEARQCNAIAEALGISGQKCSALLKQLVDSGKIEKYTEKRVTYFKAVEA